MEEKLKQAIKLFNEILEWNYSLDNQDEIKPELRDKIESFINECEKEPSEGNQPNSKAASCAIFDVMASAEKRYMQALEYIAEKKFEQDIGLERASDIIEKALSIASGKE